MGKSDSRWRRVPWDPRNPMVKNDFPRRLLRRIDPRVRAIVAAVLEELEYNPGAPNIAVYDEIACRISEANRDYPPEEQMGIPVKETIARQVQTAREIARKRCLAHTTVVSAQPPSVSAESVTFTDNTPVDVFTQGPEWLPPQRPALTIVVDLFSHQVMSCYPCHIDEEDAACEQPSSIMAIL